MDSEKFRGDSLALNKHLAKKGDEEGLRLYGEMISSLNVILRELYKR